MREEDAILRGDTYEVDGIFDTVKDWTKAVYNKITGKSNEAQQAAEQQQQATNAQQAAEVQVQQQQADEKKKKIKKIAIIAGAGVAGAALLYLIFNKTKQQ